MSGRYISVEVQTEGKGAHLGPVQKELYWQFLPVYFEFCVSSDNIPAVEQETSSRSAKGHQDVFDDTMIMRLTQDR